MKQNKIFEEKLAFFGMLAIIITIIICIFL
jgi:hypothetical protein